MSDNAGSPFLLSQFVSSADCPIPEVGAALSLCAVLVPAALTLKFTLFIKTHTCNVACDAGNQCTRLAMFSGDGEMVTWISFAHDIQNTQFQVSPHLFKNKCSSNCKKKKRKEICFVDILLDPGIVDF